MTLSRPIRCGHDGAASSSPHAGHSAPDGQPLPPLRFQPLRRTNDDGLRSKIDALAAELRCQEKRSRRRTADELAKFDAAVEAVVCNLLRPELTTSPDAARAVLAVPRGNDVLQGGPSRYRPLAYGQHFRDVLDLMESLGFIVTVTTGYNVHRFQRSALTTIRPVRDKLAHRFPAGSLDFSTVDFLDPPELIVLKDRKDKTPIDYAETAETERWRRETHAINAMLRAAPITLAGEVAADSDGYLPSADDRSLRRIFNNGDWQQGGRLSGGFWMHMQRADRYRTIRIGGEPVVNVDLQQCHLRLAYADAGAYLPDSRPDQVSEPSAADLYVAGPGSREGWKRMTNAALNRQAARNAWPARSAQERQDIASLFPRGTKPADVFAAIGRKHAPIAHLFDCGMGLRYQRREADILADAMLRLIACGVPALPLHDSVIVAALHAQAAREIFESVAQDHAGVRIPAKIEAAEMRAGGPF